MRLFATINGCFFFLFEGFKQSLFVLVLDDLFDTCILLRLHKYGLTGFPIILYDPWLINTWFFVLIALLVVLLFIVF